MDTYFTQNLPGDIFWSDEPFPIPKASDFVRFEEREIGQENNLITSDNNNNNNNNSNRGVSNNNMNKRVIEFLKRRNIISGVGKIEAEHEKDRSFRHMMSERMRREKQKQGYFALHSTLPIGTKNDKNTIVTIAATKIKELESLRDRLRNRRTELEAVLAAENNKNNSKLIRVKLDYPSSGVDSMVELLNFLKRLGLKAKNIRSVFGEDEFSAELQIETKVEASEIEEAIQVTLYEADLKFRCRFWD